MRGWGWLGLIILLGSGAAWACDPAAHVETECFRGQYSYGVHSTCPGFPVSCFVAVNNTQGCAPWTVTGVRARVYNDGYVDEGLYPNALFGDGEFTAYVGDEGYGMALVPVARNQPGQLAIDLVVTLYDWRTRTTHVETHRDGIAILDCRCDGGPC